LVIRLNTRQKQGASRKPQRALISSSFTLCYTMSAARTRMVSYRVVRPVIAA
jgi:hypothetical protein